jgi:hypothetical protein
MFCLEHQYVLRVQVIWDSIALAGTFSSQCSMFASCHYISILQLVVESGTTIMTLPSALMSAVLQLFDAVYASLQASGRYDSCHGIPAAGAAEAAAEPACGQPQEHCGLLLVCQVCPGVPTKPPIP